MNGIRESENMNDFQVNLIEWCTFTNESCISCNLNHGMNLDIEMKYAPQCPIMKDQMNHGMSLKWTWTNEIDPDQATRSWTCKALNEP